MKRIFLCWLFLMLVIGWADFSEATLMQTTWTGQIDQASIQGDLALSLFQGVPNVSWTTTYDDKGSEWHKYDDATGAVTETFSENFPPDIPGGYRSDAAIIFDDKIENFFSAATDTTDTHWSAQYTMWGAQDVLMSYQMNGVRLWGENSHYGNMSLNYFQDNRQVVVFNRITASTTLAPVPEPDTMLLFGLGILGLAGITRKKLSK